MDYSSAEPLKARRMSNLGLAREMQGVGAVRELPSQLMMGRSAAADVEATLVHGAHRARSSDLLFLAKDSLPMQSSA